jgi:hypothetical protein
MMPIRKFLLPLLSLLVLFLSSERLAKAQGMVAPVPCPQFFSTTGTPLAGGFLYAYLSGTYTQTATYTDYTLTTPNPYPIVLNAGGYPVAPSGSCGIWLSPSTTYRFVLQNSSGVTLWTVDGVITSNLTAVLAQPNTWIGYQTFSGGLSTPSFTATTLSTSALEGACFLDGVTNTTLAAAVACATGRGGKVWIPPSASNYSLTSTVTLPSGIDLECLGGTGLSSQINGPCTFLVTPGVTALAITGSHVSVKGIHIISQDSSSGTDDCIRIEGDFARITAVTCEHFGRDGFRIDSTGGSGFADFAHFEDDYANANYGDGFHWAPSGTDENAGVCLRCDAYNNTGYGFHAEQGNDNVIINSTVQNNTAGGYYLANATAWNFINPYCEAGTGSSFVMASTAAWIRAQMPFFGQCTTITNSGGISNQYNYGTTGVAPQNNGVLIGPDAGATTPIIYQLQSGVQGNGYASMYDVTDSVLIWQYFPSTKIFDFLVPPETTVNSANRFLIATGNSNGSHNDSGFMQTASASGCTTAASIGGVCASPITVTWPVAFADTSYEAICSPLGAPTNLPGTPYVVAGQTAAAITVNYFAITAAAASWPTIQCVAIHN